MTDISLVLMIPSAVLAMITSSSAVFSKRVFCKEYLAFVEEKFPKELLQSFKVCDLQLPDFLALGRDDDEE